MHWETPKVFSSGLWGLYVFFSFSGWGEKRQSASTPSTPNAARCFGATRGAGQVLSKPSKHLESIATFGTVFFFPWSASLLMEEIDRRAGQFIWK